MSFTRLVDRLEAMDRRQRRHYFAGLHGRALTTLAWILCNLAALAWSAGEPIATEEGVPRPAATALVAAAQGCFAVLMFPAVLAHRRGLGLRRLSGSEALLWLLTGVIFVASAIFADNLPWRWLAIVPAASLAWFAAGAALARLGSLERPMALPVMCMMGGLAAIVLLAACGLDAALQCALNLYPPTLAHRLVERGLSRTNLWPAAGLAAWVAMSAAVWFFTRKRRAGGC